MKAKACFLAAFTDRPCDGRLVRAHLIPQQLIRRELLDRRGELKAPLAALGRTMPKGRDLRWDDRTWVWACGGPQGSAGHHGMLDASRTLRIPRAALPEDVEEFANEFGLTWWLDRTYGEVT